LKADNTTTTDSKTEKKDESGVDMAQLDGATTWQNGSAGLDEPEFDVNVKLADLQEDPNNPLYSAKSFDQLNLYVPPCIYISMKMLTYCTAARNSSKDSPS
jgi:hypothetical protein